mgnify:FL=1
MLSPPIIIVLQLIKYLYITNYTIFYLFKQYFLTNLCTGLNHENFKKSLLIIEIKWLADFYLLNLTSVEFYVNVYVNKLKGGNIMDKKVKYKKLAERAFRQALKEEEGLISLQIDPLVHLDEVDFNNKEEFKAFMNRSCPFFMDIEDKEGWQICIDTLQKLVIQKYNNLENEELKPTQALQLILLMETFSSMTWIQDNLKERLTELPMSTYLVSKLYIMPNIVPEDFFEFFKELNKVF